MCSSKAWGKQVCWRKFLNSSDKTKRESLRIFKRSAMLSLAFSTVIDCERAVDRLAVCSWGDSLRLICKRLIWAAIFSSVMSCFLAGLVKHYNSVISTNAVRAFKSTIVYFNAPT